MQLEKIDVAQEAAKLFQRLQESGENIEFAEPAEKNTYFRVATALLEKLLELQERSAGVKRYNEFSDIVLQIMEDEMSPEQRRRVMDRLESAAKGPVS